MTSLVKQVIGVWQGADGSIAEMIYDGSPLDAMTLFEKVESLPDPARKISAYLLLENEERSVLPFIGVAYMLPDRTGVVAIFEPGQYVKEDGTDHFPQPNNAAIFNADGSLRFQLKLDWKGGRIEAFHGGAMPRSYKDHLGVVIATHPDAPPEWVYAIDPNKPELISTGQWVRG